MFRIPRAALLLLAPLAASPATAQVIQPVCETSGGVTTCTWSVPVNWEWEVPPDVFEAEFEVYGAQGGGTLGFGGKGGMAGATVPLTPGTTWRITVASKGRDSLPGGNAIGGVPLGGPGGGFPGGPGGSQGGSSGGGRGEVRPCGISGSCDPLIIAGGGGGGGYPFGSITPPGGGDGGEAGSPGESSPDGAGGGGGGTAAAGGSAGAAGSQGACVNVSFAGEAGDAGAQGEGGAGGFACFSGGGGGAGYHGGGGGGGEGSRPGAGGGGGSSYVDPGLTNAHFASGVQEGDGKVVIRWAVPQIELFDEVALNQPGQDHTVTALVTLGPDPLEGEEVDFAVVSGPNAGTGNASGSCTDALGNDVGTSCPTDVDGIVNFTYTSDGSTGVDEIQASFTDGASNVALKFWDADCNANEVPDTCDLDCAGFDAACEVYDGADGRGLCGGSEDATGDGVPDDCNSPPECDGAVAEPDELWPPNHAFKAIAIAGVTDANGDAVEVTIDSVFQDELIVGRGSGRTAPDAAGVGTGAVAVRAERAGSEEEPGDGRVYSIAFTATDLGGASCTGTVTVCVPHDRMPDYACVDQGPLHDSTEVPSEPGARCGLGAELAFLLPPLFWLRRRRSRARREGVRA